MFRKDRDNRAEKGHGKGIHLHIKDNLTTLALIKSGLGHFPPPRVLFQRKNANNVA